MSKEVRRVPVGWKHPTQPNHYHAPNIPGYLLSRLHPPEESFVPLFGTPYSIAYSQWEENRRTWETGTHKSLQFLLDYHSAEGYLDHNGVRLNPIPLEVYASDEETVLRSFYPQTVADIIEALPYSTQEMKPTRETHMPDFPSDTPLGYCLYETMSEGTPTTPVFATPNALIDWLTTKGEDYSTEPMRRESAEAIVRKGYTFGSMITIGGIAYNSTTDADKLGELK